MTRDDAQHKAATPPAAILTEEGGARFYRIPHKDGPHAKCGTIALDGRGLVHWAASYSEFGQPLGEGDQPGNPLAKDYGTAIQQGGCTAAVSFLAHWLACG